MSNTDGQLPKPQTETAAKATVATRYLGTFGSGAIAVLFVVAGLPVEQQQQVLANIHTIVDATHQIIGAAANIWYIVFPVLAVWLGKIGVDSSGFKAMVDKVFAAAQAGDKGAALTIIKAAAAPQIGTKAIINPELSTADTPPTVAASVSELPPQVKEDVK